MRHHIILNNDLELNGYSYWQPANYEILLSEKNRLIFQFYSDYSKVFDSFFKELNEGSPVKLYFSNKSSNSIYLVTNTNFILLPQIPDNAQTFVDNGEVIYAAKDRHGDILFIID